MKYLLREETGIIFGLQQGKTLIVTRLTSYDTTTDYGRKQCRDILNLSLMQMYNKMYYGDFTKETIEATLLKLT